MMIAMNRLMLLLAFVVPTISGFVMKPVIRTANSNSLTEIKGAESEVDFGELDGTNIRVGIIRTRWNKENVDNLVKGCREALKDCKVKEENIFVTEVPGSYELPLAARFLALSGTVDAIVTAGVLIKGETYHFEYISDAVASGLMNVQLSTMTPIIYGVLNCLSEDQVIARSTGDTNHGYDWGKTAVEMALLRADALALKTGGGDANLEKMGFGKATPVETKEKGGFF